MTKGLAFDLDPMITGLQSTGLANEVLVRSLSQSIEFDGYSGQIRVNRDTLAQVAQRELSEDLMEPFISAFNDVANGGMAVFGTPEEIDRQTAVAVPWTVISDLIFALRGTPMELRRELGIERADNPAEAVRLLRTRFPNVPEWMVAGNAAERLTRNPVALAGEGWEGPGGRGDERPPKPPGSSLPQQGWEGIVVPAAQDVIDVAGCLVNGNWGPAFGVWWGWGYGFEVCINQACADGLANLLIGVGGGPALLKGIKDVLSAATIQAGIKALSMTAGLAIAIFAFVLGWNIRLVNWARGVCLRFNWPVIGGPGMFVIAFAGS